jgi:4-alpha-glucanotransferase
MGQDRRVNDGRRVTDGPAPDDWGIIADWVDANDRPQRVADASVQRLRAIIGRPPAELVDRAPIITRPGRELGVGPVGVRLEDGSWRDLDGVLPADFPLGYHTVVSADGSERPLIVSPGRCWMPRERQAWGWSVQLYAVRSRDSWGIGDLSDLRRLRLWAQELGAGFLLVNPLHATAPTLPQPTSPYLPATRRFRHPLYLRIEEVPGADRVDLADLATAGRALNAGPLIDRDAVWRLKLAALERIFAAVRDVDEHAKAEPDESAAPRDQENFSAWRAQQGEALAEFAVWCALAERHGPDWRSWEHSLQRPDSPEVAEFGAAVAARVTFYAWLQWLLDMQLRRASGDLTVIQDLPIGIDAGGADAWVLQGQLALDARIGAPPDLFNLAGQEWGSVPLNPWCLRANAYQAFVESVRATLAGGGGLRIDHALGMFRLWWIPAGEFPTAGAYVRYPSADLLDIVALESVRASAPVVGEDLGTVEPGVREALAEHGLLSYRLLWFEPDSPAGWSTASMAAVTTHDLPTVAGLWTGSDLTEQRRYLDGADPEFAAELHRGRRRLLHQLDQPGGPPPGSSIEEAVLGAYRLLAQSPSMLLCATLEDAVAAEVRPNLPAVVDRPNWCIPLPVALEELVRHPTAHKLAAVLASRTPAPP